MKNKYGHNKTALLLGGTSETSFLARYLLDLGYQVIISTATDLSLQLPVHRYIVRRCGRLDHKSMIQLIEQQRIRLVVDATHPYSTEISSLAVAVTNRLGVPLEQYHRPPAITATDEVTFARDHQHAAKLCVSNRKPILLTIGTKNLAPYVRSAAVVKVPIFARVLDNPTSLEICHKLGLERSALILGRGPFSVEDNRKLISDYRIQVLVTKDSGTVGGVRAKLEAARLEGVEVIVVQRPMFRSAGCQTSV